jgi:hypothetical protein
MGNATKPCLEKCSSLFSQCILCNEKHTRRRTIPRRGWLLLCGYVLGKSVNGSSKKHSRNISTLLTQFEETFSFAEGPKSYTV